MDGANIGDLGRDYAGPVRDLLTLGKSDAADPENWIDYPAQFGLGPDDIDALIRMACDASLYESDWESSISWAPIHAWRTLAQLRAEAAVAPLLLVPATLDDIFADDEVPEVLAVIGPAALAPIAGLLADASASSSAICTAIVTLGKIGLRHPESRADCIAMLAGTLRPKSRTDATNQGLAVGALIDLHAVEAIEPIRAAFARDTIDISIVGDIEDVEIELGLRETRATPQPHYLLMPDLGSFDAEDDGPPLLPVRPRSEKIGRNQPCPCGSGRKYKKCWLP